MRAFLILLSLLAISCGKNTNNLGGEKAISAVEQKSFLTIALTEGKSSFRPKILNSVVEEFFPSENKDLKIKINEELEKFEMDARDLKTYSEKEKNLAKVIVSYPSRTEIYFLQENVPLTDLVSKLGLPFEEDRTFKLLKTDYVKTYAGGVFYLVHLNHDDLIKNDELFSVVQSDFKNQFAAKEMIVDSRKKIEVDVTYAFYIQKIVTGSFTGRSTNCRSVSREADDCGPCTYQKYIPSTEYVLSAPSSLNDLGFALRINGKVFNVQELKLTKVSEGKFTAVIATDINIDKQHIEVIQNPSQSYIQGSQGFNYASSCITRNNENITISSKANVSVNLKILGRGRELKVIKL